MPRMTVLELAAAIRDYTPVSAVPAPPVKPDKQLISVDKLNQTVTVRLPGHAPQTINAVHGERYTARSISLALQGEKLSRAELG